jgi:hypothetical protein
MQARTMGRWILAHAIFHVSCVLLSGGVQGVEQEELADQDVSSNAKTLLLCGYAAATAALYWIICIRAKATDVERGAWSRPITITLITIATFAMSFVSTHASLLLAVLAIFSVVQVLLDASSRLADDAFSQTYSEQGPPNMAAALLQGFEQDGGNYYGPMPPDMDDRDIDERPRYTPEFQSRLSDAEQWTGSTQPSQRRASLLTSAHAVASLASHDAVTEDENKVNAARLQRKRGSLAGVLTQDDIETFDESERAHRKMTIMGDLEDLGRVHDLSFEHVQQMQQYDSSHTIPTPAQLMQERESIVRGRLENLPTSELIDLIMDVTNRRATVDHNDPDVPDATIDDGDAFETQDIADNDIAADDAANAATLQGVEQDDLDDLSDDDDDDARQ